MLKVVLVVSVFLLESIKQTLFPCLSQLPEASCILLSVVFFSIFKANNAAFSLFYDLPPLYKDPAIPVSRR